MRKHLSSFARALENAVAIHHESLGETVFACLSTIVEDLRHRHLNEIDCPDCGARLEAKAATGKGAAGLAGMACRNRHGAWIDQDMLREIRRRLDTAVGMQSGGETRK
jgi:hypothetical protein